MNQVFQRLLVAAAITCVQVSFVAAQQANQVDDATRFGPGIVRIIAPNPLPEETFSGPLPLQKFLAAHPEIEWKAPEFPDGTPHFNSRSRTLVEKAKQVILRREIHGFEFAFKPMRQLYVDVPQVNGLMKRKLIWYLVFRIRYLGGDLRAKKVLDKHNNETYPTIESVAYQKRRCFPMFVLSIPSKGKEYVDRLLPTAREPIAIREQITSPLYNTVEISSVSIPRTTAEDAPGVWGYAAWEHIDPTTDFFSIYVHGLTNAFRITQEGGEDKITRKVLQLNFFRPGDTVRQLDDEIRFGLPAFKDPKEQAYVLKQYGLPERLDYRWIFR